MQIIKSAYYDQFRCIADRCPDSCCHEWEVQVDAKSARFYRELPGQLGDRLREVLRDEELETFMRNENGRCPMWREDGLCRIQAELGHDALCKTCREFPRIRHDYGDFVELGLELSCPEAARLIITSPCHPPVVQELPGGEAEYDAVDMDILRSTREEMLRILSDSRFSVNQTLAIGLLYGYEAQSMLDGAQAQSFDAARALAAAEGFAKSGDGREVLAFFAELEILTDRWKQRLQAPVPMESWTEGLRAVARYLTERYWLQAVSDFDLVGRVKFILVSCLVIKLLGGDLLETAQLYSKEIENDAQNVDAILEGVYTAPALTDDKLLGLLLQK